MKRLIKKFICWAMPDLKNAFIIMNLSHKITDIDREILNIRRLIGKSDYLEESDLIDMFNSLKTTRDIQNNRLHKTEAGIKDLKSKLTNISTTLRMQSDQITDSFTQLNNIKKNLDMRSEQASRYKNTVGTHLEVIEQTATSDRKTFANSIQEATKLIKEIQNSVSQINQNINETKTHLRLCNLEDITQVYTGHLSTPIPVSEAIDIILKYLDIKFKHVQTEEFYTVESTKSKKRKK